jgi:hypothetical protein
MAALRKALVLILLLGLAGCVSLQQVTDWPHHRTVTTRDDGSGGSSNGDGGSGSTDPSGGQGGPPG